MSKIIEDPKEDQSNFESNVSLQGPNIKSNLAKLNPKKKDDSSDSEIEMEDGGGLYYDFDKPKKQSTAANEGASPPID